MYIKELEIDKFKTFANKVNIPFLKGFTAIAGLNGSGKSNIIDAILFSLGLATANEMREKKLSDFISLNTRQNEASVSVTFETENDEEPDLKITRKIKKGSQGYSSTYYLNERPTSLSSIHLVLDKYNVNPNSYNVIMQNDINKIITCTAGERRKILEEIAGTADFDRRIEQATNELNTVEQRVEKSILILNEISANLENLSQEREQALKYKKLRDEKTVYESQITTAKYFDTQKSIELNHQNILDFNKKKKEEEIKLSDVDKEINETQSKFNNIEELVKSKGETEQLEVKKQVEEKKGDIERKKAASNLAEKTIAQNLQSIENSENGIETAKKKIDDNKNLINDKKLEIEKIEEEIKLKREEIEKIALEVSGLSQTANEFLKKRADLNLQLNNAKDEDLNIQKEKAPLEAEYNSLKKELTQINTNLENFEKFKAEFKTKKDSLNAQIEELSKEMEDFRLIQENTMNKLDKTKNDISSLAYDIRTAQNTIAKLEGQKRAYEEANMGDGIDIIMNAKLKGVHAPLAQLGIVDKEYSIALEIAMGGRMKNIVVDDDYVAQNAIEILKSRGKRLTFLPLNKIKPAPKGLKLPKDKGVIDFAINLVDFEDEYLDVFFYALGDTIVVEDFTTAQQLIGKYRIVTLSGELFEKSGAITGGAVKKSGLKFSTGDNDEIANYKQRLVDFEKKFNTLEDERSTLEDKLEKIRESYSSTKTEHSKAQIELNSLNKNNEETLANIEANEKRQAEVLSLIDKDDKKLNSLEEKTISNNELILKLQEQIEEIESQISEEELDKLKSSTEALEKEADELEKKKAKISIEIEGIEKDIEFNKQTVIKTNQQKIETLKENNNELKNDIENKKVEIEEIQQTIEKLNAKIEELGDVLKELQKQRDEINLELSNLFKKKGTYESNLERIGENLEAAKARRKELDPIMEEIRNQLIEAGIDITKLEPVESSVDELTAKINRLEKRMQELEPVNMRAIDSYDNCLARKNELDEKINTLSAERKEILSKMDSYQESKKNTFLETYESINKNFIEVYEKLSEGHGNLVLENYESPFEGGLELEAQPKGKKKTHLQALSGGERSLAALSFVFAIQKNAPAPFYALDEVDAALDPVNVDRVAEMVKTQSKDTQFIVVTHKLPMMETANRTVGVSLKANGVSHVTGISNRELVEYVDENN